MRRRRWKPKLTERQQLILAVLLILMLATSMLYCLGVASLAAREAWETAPLPWTDPEAPDKDPDAAPTAPPLAPSEPITTAP